MTENSESRNILIKLGMTPAAHPIHAFGTTLMLYELVRPPLRACPGDGIDGGSVRRLLENNGDLRLHELRCRHGTLLVPIPGSKVESSSSDWPNFLGGTSVYEELRDDGTTEGLLSRRGYAVGKRRPVLTRISDTPLFSPQARLNNHDNRWRPGGDRSGHWNLLISLDD